MSSDQRALVFSVHCAVRVLYASVQYLHAGAPTVGALLYRPGLAADAVAAVTDDVLLEGELPHAAVVHVLQRDRQLVHQVLGSPGKRLVSIVVQIVMTVGAQGMMGMTTMTPIMLPIPLATSTEDQTNDVNNDIDVVAGDTGDTNVVGVIRPSEGRPL